MGPQHQITNEQVKKTDPSVDETVAELMLTYTNLIDTAVQLGLLKQAEVAELEERHKAIENIAERLHYLSADVLSLLQNLEHNVQVPTDPQEFALWVKQSDVYPKVRCHDAFFDVFIASKKALIEEG